MNLAEARVELADRGFEYLTASRMNLMLNRGLTDFEDFYPFPWLRKTTTGPAPLTITDLKYVRRVYDGLGNEVMGVDDAADIDVTQTGTPQSWWIDDSSGSTVLTAYPVGSVTFTVAYVADSTPLSVDTDTPKIPARYHNTWLDLAVVHGYKDSDNFAAAGALRNLAQADLQTIVERYETRNRMNSNYVLLRSEDG